MAKEYIEREAVLEKQIGVVVYDEGGWDANVRAVPVEDIEAIPAADVVEVPKTGIGDLSDGYHTFNELYHHRAVLFAAMCNTYPHLAWKSKKHDTGDMFEGMFIVGIETPEGQATYHYDVDPYWDMFHVKALDRAPAWDGHTPSEAIRRISTIDPSPKWIPVTERLPENEQDVLITVRRKHYCKPGEYIRFVVKAFYTDGKHDTEHSSYTWFDDMEYDEESDAYKIPEGWWESIEYGEEFQAVGDFVTHWMPLPKPPEDGGAENE